MSLSKAVACLNSSAYLFMTETNRLTTFPSLQLPTVKCKAQNTIVIPVEPHPDSFLTLLIPRIILLPSFQPTLTITKPQQIRLLVMCLLKAQDQLLNLQMYFRKSIKKSRSFLLLTVNILVMLA